MGLDIYLHIYSYVIRILLDGYSTILIHFIHSNTGCADPDENCAGKILFLIWMWNKWIRTFSKVIYPVSFLLGITMVFSFH